MRIATGKDHDRNKKSERAENEENRPNTTIYHLEMPIVNVNKNVARTVNKAISGVQIAFIPSLS